ncbi:hypothetical protein SNEBB_004167 [Seison nebaliae]|nr:hypothetical protein SNEBB_004167 [Seison nebaliae]
MVPKFIYLLVLLHFASQYYCSPVDNTSTQIINFCKSINKNSLQQNILDNNCNKYVICLKKAPYYISKECKKNFSFHPRYKRCTNSWLVPGCGLKTREGKLVPRLKRLN